MRRLFPVLYLLPLLVTGCPTDDPISPEEAAEAVYGVSSVARDGLLLIQLREGPAELAPIAAEPESTDEAAAAVAQIGAAALPPEGASWTDEFGNFYRIRQIDHDIPSQTAVVFVDVVFIAIDERATGELVYTIWVGPDILDDTDDRFLAFESGTDFRDGSFEWFEYFDRDVCDPMIDCELMTGGIGIRLNRNFTNDPHIATWRYEVDMDLGTLADDPTDNLFERELFGALRLDGLDYERTYLPSVPIQPGTAPPSGTITDVASYPDGYEVANVARTVFWISEDEGDIQTDVNYADGSLDTYMVNFAADKTGNITGTRADGSTVTGTINRTGNLDRNTMTILAPDGARVDVDVEFQVNAVQIKRDVTIGDSTFTAIGVATGGEDGTIEVDYTDTRGYIGEASLDFRQSGNVVLRNAVVATPDDDQLRFELTFTPSGEGRVTFERTAVDGNLSMIPVGGARGELRNDNQARDIVIDAVGRLQPEHP